MTGAAGLGRACNFLHCSHCRVPDDSKRPGLAEAKALPAVLPRRCDECHSKAPAMKAGLLLLAFWGQVAVYAADATDKAVLETGKGSPIDPVGEHSRSRPDTTVVSSLAESSRSTATRTVRCSICPKLGATISVTKLCIKT